MKLAPTAAAVLVLGCGSAADRDAKLADGLCERLAGRYERRLRANEASLPQLRSFAAADAVGRLQHSLNPTVNDAVESYQTMLTIGAVCATVMEGECSQTISSWFLDDLDGGFRTMRTLLDGMRGRGPCALSRDASRQRPCHSLGSRLDRERTFLDLVREGWQAPIDARGLPTEHAAFAASRMAAWRALLDYGLAAAPVCAAQAAASCEQLADGLLDATPDELVRRMDALAKAFRDGVPCPRPDMAAAADARPTR
jgi:hypothetical protein